VAGWDAEKGGQVFALPIGGALLPRDYSTGGSGSTYIYGFCDAFYKKDMTKEQCEEFVIKGGRRPLLCTRTHTQTRALPTLHTISLPTRPQQPAHPLHLTRRTPTRPTPPAPPGAHTAAPRRHGPLLQACDLRCQPATHPPTPTQSFLG
jgi:hypothetical protein